MVIRGSGEAQRPFPAVMRPIEPVLSPGVAPKGALHLHLHLHSGFCDRDLSFPKLNLSPDPQVSVELASETLVRDGLY